MNATSALLPSVSAMRLRTKDPSNWSNVTRSYALMLCLLLFQTAHADVSDPLDMTNCCDLAIVCDQSMLIEAERLASWRS